MEKKHTYSPKKIEKYDKGGKNTYKDKKSKKGDINNFVDWGELLGNISGPIADMFGIQGMNTQIGDWMTEAQNQQATAGTTALGLAGQLGAGPTPTDTLSDYRDQIGISKPKKTSTEFVENIQDTIGQQTAGVLSDVGRTGKFAGIKDIQGS